jgi:hypothetical protein
VEVEKSGGEFTVLDGTALTIDDDVVVMEFGVGIENVNCRCAVFDIVDNEAVIVDMVKGFPFNRD